MCVLKLFSWIYNFLEPNFVWLIYNHLEEKLYEYIYFS